MSNKRTVLSIVTVLFWVSLYAYVPQLSNYARELGASYKLIGLIGGAYGLSQTLLRIPIGIASDKLKMRKIFIVGGIISAVISAALMYLFTSPYILLLGRLVAGIGAATWVNFTILYISYYNEEESNKAVGIINSNSKLGQLIAMFIGGFIAIRLGVRAIFLFSIVISVVSLGMVIFVQEDKVIKEHKSNISSQGIVSVMKDKRVLHISILAALLQFINYATNFGFTPIIAANLGANGLQLGFLTTLYNLPQILFSILANTIIANKIGQKNTMLLGFILTTSVCFITPLAPNLYILYILQIIAGIGSSMAFSLLMAMVIKGVKGHLMTTTMGLFQAVFGIGMVIGPIVLGSVGDYFGLTMGFIVVGVLGLISIGSVYRLEFK